MSRKDDAKVAEVVFGFHKPPPMTYRDAGKEDKGGCTCFLIEREGWIADVDWGGADHDKRLDDPIPWEPMYEYTTDPAADYQVLERVREKWGETRLCEMRDELQTTWARRAQELEKSASDLEDLQVYGCTQYRPGDYSRAALATIEKEQADGQG